MGFAMGRFYSLVTASVVSLHVCVDCFFHSRAVLSSVSTMTTPVFSLSCHAATGLECTSPPPSPPHTHHATPLTNIAHLLVFNKSNNLISIALDMGLLFSFFFSNFPNYFLLKKECSPLLLFRVYSV